MAKARRRAKSKSSHGPMGAHTILISVPAGSHITAVARKTSDKVAFARKVRIKTDARPSAVRIGKLSESARARRKKASSAKMSASKKRRTKRTAKSAHKSTRGMATRAKHDGGVSKRRATKYGVMAARLGRTVHTAKGKRPKGYTKADAVVAQRASAAEKKRMRDGGKRRAKRRSR